MKHNSPRKSRFLKFMTRYFTETATLIFVFTIILSYISGLMHNSASHNAAEASQPTTTTSPQVVYYREHNTSTTTSSSTQTTTSASSAPSTTNATTTSHRSQPVDENSSEECTDYDDDESTQYDVFNPSPDEEFLSEKEKRDLAAIVYLEAGSQSIQCQRNVCSAIINRMKLWGKSLHQVIYQANQFSPAAYVSTTNPTDKQFEVVEYVLSTGCTLPQYVCYFRADYYHDWAGMNDYSDVDNVYFSYSDRDYQLSA